MTRAEELICVVLRGDAPLWPESADADFGDSVVDAARRHGVAALLVARGLDGACPPGVVAALRRDARAGAMWELRHQAVLARALDALAARGVDVLLLKGAALAYDAYPDPAQRARSDADLLVAEAQCAQAEGALFALGFEKIPAATETYQAAYAFCAPDGTTHVFDLHWRFNNSEVLSRLFSFETLAARARPLARLCATARGAGRVDALLIACLHRATHRSAPYYLDDAPYRGERLIWLYDIVLLARLFDAEAWGSFVARAQEIGVAPVCLEALSAAGAHLGAKIPDETIHALAGGDAESRAARYLSAGPLRQRMMDFFARPAAQKLAFLRALAFPPGDFMRARFADARLRWLPWLYARRAAAGVLRWARGA